MSEYTLKDGRKALKVENNIDSMTKVTEVYVEPKLEKKLTQRITEKFGVVERIVETLDENTGKVVDKVIEKVCEGSDSKKLSMTKSPKQLVEEKVLSKVNLKPYFIVALIAAQVLFLGYVLFFM